MLARAHGVIEAELDAAYSSLGHPDWLVGVTDGAVEVTGPVGGGERSVAEVVARTVPGVVEVRVDWGPGYPGARSGAARRPG